MGSIRSRLFRSAALAALTTLGACGGGGGVNSTPAPPAASTPTPAPTPVPAPAPTPAPTPTPSATNYDTAEYRATVGAVSMNALAAYAKSATGAGVTVGVIDSGIDLQSQEFTGRLSPASASVAGNSSIDDEDGHGTAVAFTLAGRRNGSGSQGVAFDATLVVARADSPGTCTATSGDEAQCSFNDDNIAKGVDLARTAGARVVNISLGGDDFASPALLAAVDRATAAGVIVVVAAGNKGAAAPENSALFADDAARARGLVVIAGSVGAADAISSFSNRAGGSATHYLAAVGERVRAPDQNDTAYLWSGTSFAAPQIAGAIALLAQAFPNLTGAQIVDLLYRTARDAGTTGVDAVYGNGILDLTRAFQPVGTTSIAGSHVAASLASNAVLSTPMGDAKGGTLGAVVLDSYGRAFGVDLAGTVGRARPVPALANALATNVRDVSLAAGGMAASVTLAPGRQGAVPQALRLSAGDAIAARAIAARVTQRLGETLTLGFGFAQGMGTLTASLSPGGEPAFLIARDDGLGFDSAPRAAAALRQAMGRIGVTAAVESGDILARRDPLLAGLSGWRRAPYDRASLLVDARFGRLRASLGATRLHERATALGAQFDPALGSPGASSWFADTRADLTLGDGWAIGGSMRRGWTGTHGAFGRGSLLTGAHAATIDKWGLFGRDRLSLRVAQPLRVSRGGIDLTLPTLWDYDSASVTAWTTQRMNLAPSGRELDMELGYRRPLWLGQIDANLFWRRDPGHIAALPDDRGLAFRYGLAF